MLWNKLNITLVLVLFSFTLYAVAGDNDVYVTVEHDDVAEVVNTFFAHTEGPSEKTTTYNVDVNVENDPVWVWIEDFFNNPQSAKNTAAKHSSKNCTACSWCSPVPDADGPDWWSTLIKKECYRTCGDYCAAH